MRGARRRRRADVESRAGVDAGTSAGAVVATMAVVVMANPSPGPKATTTAMVRHS